MFIISGDVMFVGAPGANEEALAREFAGHEPDVAQPEHAPATSDEDDEDAAAWRAVRVERRARFAEPCARLDVTPIGYASYTLADKDARIHYVVLHVAALDIARAARWNNLSVMVYAYDARASRSLEALVAKLAVAAYVPANVHVLVGTHADELGAERTAAASAALATSRSFAMHVRLGEAGASVEDLRRGIAEKLLLARTDELVARDQRASRGLLAPLKDWLAWAVSGKW